MLLLKFLLLCYIICKCYSLPNEEILRRYVRQGLDAVAQDVLSTQDARILHGYKFNSGIGNREELIVKNIKFDEDFNIGQHVVEWQSINYQDTSIAVGQLLYGITVLSSKPNRTSTNGFIKYTKIIDLKAELTAFTLYKNWNDDKMQYEIFLVVATSENYKTHLLQCFLITEEIGLKRVWWSDIPQRVAHLKVFQFNNLFKLLTINEKYINSDATTANIYNLNNDGQNFIIKISKTLVLDTPAKSSAINEFHGNIYLSIPQQTANEVLIFNLQDKNNFPFQKLKSTNVNIVTSFSISSQEFLAIGGYEYGIFRFTNKGLVKEEIDAQFEDVTYFLPLPINTYRDEVLLLVQHHLDYDTHTAPIVKVLMYSQKMFMVHDEIPCEILGHLLHGAECMIDAELDTGIIGSAPIVAGKHLGVILPRFEEESKLFVFDWDLVETVNPIAHKIDNIIKSRITIQKILQQQQNDIKEIQDSLINSLNPNVDNEVTGNWKINTLVASNLKFPNKQYEPNEHYEQFDYVPMENEFKIVAKEIDSIGRKVSNARTANSPGQYSFDYLKIEGPLNVEGPSNIDNIFISKLNDETFNNLVEDCAKRSENNVLSGTKVFKKAEIESVYFENINNISAKDIVYNPGDVIRVKGDVTFTNPLRVRENVYLPENGTVNNMRLKHELVYMTPDAIFSNINFEHLTVNYLNNVEKINNKDMRDIMKYDNVNYDGFIIQEDYLNLSNINIRTTHINNQEFTEFVNNICLKNVECNITKSVTVEGKLKIIQNAEIKTLNGLKYPDEYLLFHPRGHFTKITGKKTFLGNVSTTEVIVEETIDGLNPNEVITLSSPQNIPDNFTFADLEITESFRVDGDILVGPNLTKFIPNPTLEDTNIVENNVMFRSLEVDGLVIVNNLFNDITLTELFENVVYKDEEIVKINSEKKFTKGLTIEENLNLESNIINNININQIITSDTEQTIPTQEIRGNVVIDNLEISGLFNNFDLNKQFNEFIHLDKDETIESEITIRNRDQEPDVIASEAVINVVNKLKVSDMISLTDDRVFGDVEFKAIKADKTEFKKDLRYEIEFFDIEDFAQNRFSLSKDQTITGKIRVVNGSIDDIETPQINDTEWDWIYNYLNITDILMSKLFNGFFKIGELHVAKSLNLDMLNDKNLNKLYKNAFWINRSNNISADISFQNGITTNTLQIDKLNNVKLKDVIDEIVLKNESNILLSGKKIFENGIIVNQLNTHKVNNIIVENILLRSVDQEINGNLVVHGDVWVHEDLNARKRVNGVPVRNLQHKFKMIDNNTFLIKGNVTFKYDVTINNLQVNGKSNGLNPTDYLQNIVGINDDVSISGTTTFKRKVLIHKNLGVATTVDGVNLNKMMETVVLTSSDDFIQGSVTFVKDVEVLDTVELENDLDTKVLCGCDVDDWLRKAVYIGNGHYDDHLKFENVSILTNINVENLNGIDMNTIIPLHTDQVIDSTINLGFVSVEQDLHVGKLINGHNLTEEYENTVLQNAEQEISSKLIFVNPITVLHNLKTSSFINGQDLQRLVTIDTEQNLTASYVFNGKVTIDSNLTVLGRVNNINLGDWQLRTVTASGLEEQNINDLWHVKGDVSFRENVIGEGRLCGIDVKDIANQIVTKQWQKFQVEHVIKNDYLNICSNVQDLIKIGKSRPFLFKYLEYHDTKSFDYHIAAVHHFKYGSRNYLIVSQKGSCQSLLHEWISNDFRYIEHLNTGEVEQFITVNSAENVFLVSKNNPQTKCLDSGVNIWVFGGNTLTNIFNLTHSSLLLKSKLPGTFYSLDGESIIEYKIFYEEGNSKLYEYKRWKDETLNATDFKFGMSLAKAGYDNSVLTTQESSKIDYDVRIMIENTDLGKKHYLPKTNIREIVVFDAGPVGDLLRLTAVAIWEEATIQSLADEIKIYDDFENGKLYDKIATYRPSNINILDYSKTGGQTFLAFLENYKILKVYEYKVFGGFIHRQSVGFSATNMITLSLPLSPYYGKRKFLALTNENHLTFLEAVMDGDRPSENFYCEK